MKRILCITAVIAMLSFSSIARADMVRLISASPSRVVIEYTIPPPILDAVAANGASWDSLTIPDAGFTTRIGRPQLPLISRLIAMPDRAGASVTLSDFKMSTLESLNVVPFQKPPLRCSCSVEPFKVDEDFYSTDALWPSSFVELGVPAIIHGLRVITVNFYPVRYNPITGIAEVVSSAKVEINFEGKDLRNVPISNTLHLSPAFERIFKDQVLNFGQLRNDPSTNWEPQDGLYLVLAADDYQDIIDPLVQWKTIKGLPVEVHMTSELESVTFQKIKEFIADKYANAEGGLDYVLLVGSYTQLPPGNGINDTPTDHLYTTLEGNDYFPDIVIGRLAVRNTDQAAIAVNKMVDYETAPVTETTDWFTSAMTISSSQYRDDLNAQTCGQIYTQLGDFTHVDYFLNSNGQATAKNVTDGVNQGRSWISYFGHGSETEWASIWPPYTNDDVLALQNNGKLPVVISIACSNAAFDYPSPCFAEVWINGGRDKGASGIFAASRDTPFFYSDAIGIGVNAGYFYAGFTTFGAACTYAKLFMYHYFPEPAGQTTEEVMQQFHVFGDPELNAWSAVPANMEVTYPGEITTSDSSIAFLVKLNGQPLKQALVHLFNDNFTISSIMRTAGDGTATITLGEPLEVGSYHIVVTGKNGLPYSGTLEVQGSADDDTGDDDSGLDDDAADDDSIDDDAMDGDDAGTDDDENSDDDSDDDGMPPSSDEEEGSSSGSCGCAI